MVADALKEESKRTVLTILIPGLVATFPLYLKALILLVQHDVLVNSLLVFATIGLLLGLTVGLVLENTGSIIETWISHSYSCTLVTAKPNDIPKEKLISLPKIGEINYYEYNNVWLAYLYQSVSKDNPKIIFKYYSSLVTRFRFELHMIPAIFTMIIGIYLLENTVHVSAILPHFYYVFYPFSGMVFFLMIFFAKQSIGYLHDMRFEILRSSNL